MSMPPEHPDAEAREPDGAAAAAPPIPSAAESTPGTRPPGASGAAAYAARVARLAAVAAAAETGQAEEAAASASAPTGFGEPDAAARAVAPAATAQAGSVTPATSAPEEIGAPGFATPRAGEPAAPAASPPAVRLDDPHRFATRGTDAPVLPASHATTPAAREDVASAPAPPATDDRVTPPFAAVRQRAAEPAAPVRERRGAERSVTPPFDPSTAHAAHAAPASTMRAPADTADAALVTPDALDTQQRATRPFDREALDAGDGVPTFTRREPEAAMAAAPAQPLSGSAALGTAEPDPRVPQTHRERFRSWRFAPLVEIVATVALALVLAETVQAAVVKPFVIPSESMEPTLLPGQRVLVNRLAYDLGGTPARGDIVVFHPPSSLSCKANVPLTEPCPQSVSTRGSDYFVKRVMGLPGDVLSIRDGHPVINGKELTNEPYINACVGSSTCNMPHSIVIPKGEYYMLGDNRGDSDDSRYWGPVPISWIIGQVFATYWPIDRIGIF
jgi:signal peptidase I